MKTPRPFLLALCALLFISACDLSEVNENPNNPADVPENLLLPGLLGNFSYEVIGNEPARTPSQWMQQTAWNGVQPSEDTYDLDESDVNNLWEFFSYTDVMKNSRLLNEKATANENFAYAGIAKTILAWNLMVVTDLWDMVPYSQAFDPSNTTPAYDEQEAIYAAIFDLLNQAIEDYDRPSLRSPGSDDLLYGGDMGKWERLTYTLLARAHLHLTEAPGNSAADRANLGLQALANGFTSNADDADFQYFDTAGEENPWYQFAIDGKWDTRNQMSAHYIDLLKTRQDPRLPIQARQAGAIDNNGLVPGFTPEPFTEDDFALDDSTYWGHINGQEGIGAENVSPIGAFYSAADAPLTWLSYAEAKFIEAEAVLITQGAAAADPIYREGIAASMNKLGVPAEARDDYIASRPDLSGQSNPLAELITEKYIANFLNLDIYNDWRRTGYPELSPITNNPRTPSGSIPLRYPYPDSELSNNAANVEITGIPRGFSAMEIPVWWDSEN